MRDADDWAEENGSYGRCPSCHRRIWVESACVPECYVCGYGTDFNPPFTDDDEPERHDEEKDEPAGDGRYSFPELGISQEDFR